MILTFKNHMRDRVDHVVTVDRLTEHPTCSQNVDCTLRNAKKYSEEG